MRRKVPALVLGLIVAITIMIPAPIKSDQPISYIIPENYNFIPVVPASTPMPTLVAIPDPTPKPTPKPKSIPKPVSIYYKVKYGTASTYGPGFAGLLALPEGPGIKVEVCGPAGCIIRVSNDAGPNLAMQRIGRIVDLNLFDFLAIGGSNAYAMGLIHNVKVKYIK